MFAICIESSHKKGMGHLFRALNFIDLLKSRNEPHIIFVNDNNVAIGLLKSGNLDFEIVDLTNHESDWESHLIRKYNVHVWINDRLDTDINHALNVKKNNIKLVTFDDHGTGAELADIHVAALSFASDKELKGKSVLAGVKYLILNKAIEKAKRHRKNIEHILVTLGGSDTYGVTLKVVKILKSLGKKAAIHTGPSFQHHDNLDSLINKDFNIIGNVNSLIETFYTYDLAITGGGITPFEANASGLPCIIIANEVFEIPNGRFLNDLGSSVFAGYHEKIDEDIFNKDLDIEKMSWIGMNSISLNGADNIYKEIQSH